MRAAVVNPGGRVVNVIEYDPNREYHPDGGVTVVPLDAADDATRYVAAGWEYADGAFVAPPARLVLLQEPATVTLSTTFPEDEGAEVVFTANGVSATDTVVDGSASCEVTAAETTTVEVSVAGVPVGSVEITVEA